MYHLVFFFFGKNFKIHYQVLSFLRNNIDTKNRLTEIKLNTNSDLDNRMNRLQEKQLINKHALELEPTLAAKSKLQL